MQINVIGRSFNFGCLSPTETTSLELPSLDQDGDGGEWDMYH